MLRLTDDQKRVFAEAVAAAMGHDGLRAVDEIYAAFERERVDRAPVCDQSGRCCRFEAFGHRLFVSTLEFARFRQQSTGEVGEWDGTGCPYQVRGLCSVHFARPFGCRAFFCDPTSTAWQQAQYERFHREIRELHDELGVPYLYVEWREALAAVGVAARPGSSLPVLPG